MTFRLCAALALLTVAAGCDGFSGEEQRLFEDTAYLGASDGVTADDWRVGPVLGSRVQVLRAASPNPARLRGDDGRGETVSLQLYADEAPGGFVLYRRTPQGGLEPIQALAGVSGPNIYTFNFFAGEASATGTVGSVRLVVTDGLERVVTYGDLVLR